MGRAKVRKTTAPQRTPYDGGLIQSIGLLLIGRGALRTDSALSMRRIRYADRSFDEPCTLISPLRAASMRPEATNVSYGHFRSGIPAINWAISNPKKSMATSNSGSVSDPLT